MAAHIVSAYVQSCVNTDPNREVNQAALDLSRIGPAAESMDNVALAVISHMPEAATEARRAQQISAPLSIPWFQDIACLSEELKGTTRNKAVREAAEKLCAALTSGDGNFVLAESHDRTEIDPCGGVTVCLPHPGKYMRPLYRRLDFAQKHSWLAMLQAYQAA